jgi:hypothetical protein
MNKEQVQAVLQSARKRLGKSVRFKGNYKPPEAEASCCDVKPESAKTLFSTSGGSLKPIDPTKN